MSQYQERNTATLDALQRVLYEHREDALVCYDHDRDGRRLADAWCCVCGAHELMVTWREHVADAFTIAISALSERAR